jgi:hypothetical protein
VRPAGMMSAGDHWQSAPVLLLVDSLLQCSLDTSVVVTDVTDSSMSEAHIYILLSLHRA